MLCVDDIVMVEWVIKSVCINVVIESDCCVFIGIVVRKMIV